MEYQREYNRLIEQKDSEIVARKYEIEVTRERISQEQRLEITRISSSSEWKKLQISGDN